MAIRTVRVYGGKMTTSAASIGKRIKTARLAHNTPKITQEGVVYALRERGYTTSLSTFQRWEKTGLIQSHELDELADILGVPHQWLAEGGDLERARVYRLAAQMDDEGQPPDMIFDVIAGLHNARAQRKSNGAPAAREPKIAHRGDGPVSPEHRDAVRDALAPPSEGAAPRAKRRPRRPPHEGERG